MNNAYEVLVGLALGFSLTIPPGPMNALIASRSVRSLRQGVLTGFGAMSADAVLGVVVFVLSSLVDLHTVVREIYVLGAVVMGYFGFRLLWIQNRPATIEVSDARTYSTAFGVGVSNPFQILWWLTAGLAFAYLGGAALFAGLFGAIAIWIVVFPWVLRRGAERSPRFEKAVTIVSAGIMVFFAAYFVYLAAGGGAIG